ncbi:hypothetical protein EWB00_010040 [Schistosoma japonicum]|uniref:Sperm microtubule inner protein 1 C-terminal domain-containing protein n=1 Tax=Schistosoma japonicum TaxID=6182 RepID=A0A4Z2DPW6_SCHJA|nr:hypothetical protein EWB00_010040 [Schistosoma japonicum]
MTRSYPADTRGQKILEELYEKETISQLKWFLKCQEAKRTHGLAPLTASAISDTPLPKISDILSKFNKQQQQQQQSNESEYDQNKEQVNLNEKSSDETLSTNNEIQEHKDVFTVEPDMRKPQPEVLKLLYEGISKEGKGRYQYLHDRYKLNLEEKFQFPILSSMEYGWGHSELISKTTAQSRKYGRQCVIEDSFYRRTGIPIKHGDEMLGLDQRSF